MTQTVGFPNTTSKLLDVAGNLTSVWRLFFISLWQGTDRTGDIRMIAGATIPDGWLPCDGSAVSRSKYDALFQEIGVTWGPGDGATTFNLPNLQGAAPLSAHGLYIIKT